MLSTVTASPARRVRPYLFRRRLRCIGSAIMAGVKRFTVTIEAPNWKDLQEIELPQRPREGDAIETRYGTCIVTQAEPVPDGGQYAGKIVCRLP
jgi:hypothetical protein